MRKPMASAGTTIFFVLAPGVVAGLVPWWLTGWRVRHPQPPWAWAPLRVAGVALLAAGTVVLVHAFVRFVAEGVGTPAPVAPTQRLVVGGPYRYVRKATGRDRPTLTPHTLSVSEKAGNLRWSRS